MDFYTNVTRTRDKILVRGYQNGKQKKLAVSYRPNLYIPSKKGDTPYRSLDGRPLEIVNLNSMGGAKKFKRRGFERRTNQQTFPSTSVKLLRLDPICNK